MTTKTWKSICLLLSGRNLSNNSFVQGRLNHVLSKWAIHLTTNFDTHAIHLQLLADRRPPFSSFILTILFYQNHYSFPYFRHTLLHTTCSSQVHPGGSFCTSRCIFFCLVRLASWSSVFDRIDFCLSVFLQILRHLQFFGVNFWMVSPDFFLIISPYRMLSLLPLLTLSHPYTLTIILIILYNVSYKQMCGKSPHHKL